MRRKSTPSGDAQGKGSRPISDFVHFVDAVEPKAYDFSAVKAEDEQSNMKLKSEIEKLKSKGNEKQKYDCKLNKENELEQKQVIRNQENLRNNTKMMSMKIENMSSKNEITTKKCDSNMKEDDKNLEINTIKKNIVKKII